MHTIQLQDEKGVRALYQAMLASWGDADEYAKNFTQDATYIIANGKLYHGWEGIIEGHQIIFSAWARNSHLEGRIESLKFLTDSIAQIIAYGHIVYDDNRSSDKNKRTINSLTAKKVGERWLFVAYQNTPLGTH